MPGGAWAALEDRAETWLHHQPARECLPCCLLPLSKTAVGLHRLSACASQLPELDRACCVQVVHWRAVQMLRLHLAAWQVVAEQKSRRSAQSTTALVWYAEQVSTQSWKCEKCKPD